ncbi:hypothetical protein B0F90DRAFT_1814101 [Multifurca ochricompacta]|uniref:DUF1682-domain-containing protein n=1 Tax=Multifurca ochricompacta TaxID=376703 RepID=A0AAD4MBI0_9AGAM|nr:hypothetical protein B0F90DRAFT_1814101 [Multifurca ochricompacta]
MALPFFDSLANLAQVFTPNPPTLNDEYDGLEYSWKIFVFRPALFKNEAFLLAAVVIYSTFFWFGTKINHAKANSWLSAYTGIFEKQFSLPTAGGLTADGYTDFFNFSTGRRNIASLHTVFTLRPRHDIFQLAYQVLHATVAVPDFVWALVTKGEANLVKLERWDFKFTKTTENPLLPPNVVVMSEYADVTENVLKIAGPVLEALKNPKIQPYFRSLSITDQPRTRPGVVSANKEKHVVLSLVVPPPSHTAESAPLVSAVFGLIDALEKINLRPETKGKLKKTREDFSKTLKDDAEREAREEAADAKLAAKRRAEEERIASLSAAEQQKLLERDRKRNLRKTQGKVVKK